jgi:hypothetical protein
MTSLIVADQPPILGYRGGRNILAAALQPKTSFSLINAWFTDISAETA